MEKLKLRFARWFLASLIALLGILSFATPVAASVPQPTTFEIQGIVAYQNTKENEDQLFLVTYEITGNYTQNADQLFIFRLKENTEVVSATAPFPYHDKGYGLGVVAFYFSPSDAPTWEGNISIQIIGNPLVDWDGAIPSTSFDYIDWNTGTIKEVQALVAGKILYLATLLGQDWDVELIGTTQGVTSLTSAGASYFLVVVPYAGDIVPVVFGQYTFTPDYPVDEKPAPNSYAEWLKESVEGTVFDVGPIERARGWTEGSLGTAIYYGFIIALFVLLISKGKLNKGTMLLFWPFVVAGAFFGVPLQVTIIAGFLCLISTVWVFYKGTT